jgi:hypothetical protein
MEGPSPLHGENQAWIEGWLELMRRRSGAGAVL